MAATHDNIITVAEMKAELSLVPEHISEDARIGRLIRQAVDQVSHDTGRPLIDTPAVEYADMPATDADPLVIYARDFVFDTQNTEHDIDYWTDSADLNDDPDGSISRDEIGRQVQSRDGRCYLMYLKPGDKWPANHNPRTRVRIAGARTQDVPDGLISAIVVLTRFLYLGDLTWPSSAAYRRLIAPYRRLAPTGA